MSVDKLKKDIMDLVCDEWKSSTSSIVKHNKESEIDMSRGIYQKLAGYLYAMVTMAYLLDDKNLANDISSLAILLVYFDSPSPLPGCQQKTKEQSFTVDDDGGFILAPSIGTTYQSRDGQLHTVAALWKGGVVFQGGGGATALELQGYTLHKPANKKTTPGYRVGEPHSAACPA